MAKLSFPGGTNVAKRRAQEQARLKQIKRSGAAPGAGGKPLKGG